MRDNDPFSELIRSLENDLQGDDPPPPGEGRRTITPGRGSPRLFLWIVAAIVLFVLFNRVVGFAADWVWYDSIGLTSVLRTRFVAAFSLFLGSALFFWLFVAGNILLAQRLDPSGTRGTPLEEFVEAFGLRVPTALLWAAGGIALLVGLSTSTRWEELLLSLNGQSFGVMEPLFNRDVGFYVFMLPVLQIARNWLMTLLVITLIAVTLVAGVGWRGWNIRTSVLIHLSILGALLLGLFAWQYRLDAYQLLFSTRCGAAYGASYTDIHAQLPAYNILSIVSLVAAVLLVVTAFLRSAWRAIVGVLVLWGVVAILAGNVYPGLVQRFQVSPNQLNLERPYIERNIAYTRMAFDLDEIEVLPYAADTRITAEALVADADLVHNVRLWDYRPLLQTYNQIQALRQYYQFHDVDIDRYHLDGRLYQAMVAARELVPEQLNQDAQTWVNRRLVYTHGYGAAASPVSRITRDGLPNFVLKDLPPTGVLTLTVPQIYFGELTNEFVIVRTTEPEFDYPSGDGNVTTRFSAETGIPMSVGARLLFALRFGDINILLNNDIQPDSRLLWRRQIVERIEEVAPFLHYDGDPYVVVGDDGRLDRILDAYTISNRYPYSEQFGSLNYIRNPVKVVTDAYDGTIHFYLREPDEPIAAAYAQIFPDLFSPYEEMPEHLLQHVRYPNDLFSVQAEVYRTYHMTDATEFYNKEDVWAWPEEIFGNAEQRMDPYYVMMRLPGNDELQFVQILPFTPANRENMIAWLAAKNDPAEYGEKLVFEFGKDSLVFGPKQIEARIDQDPIISAQLSLWNQQGSDVIRGNLLVIPIAGGLIYVEPLYLQALNGQIPELTRVIVATADRVVMEENLGLAIAALYGRDVLNDPALADLASDGTTVSVDAPVGETTASTAPAAPSEAEESSSDVPQLILEANRRFEAAEEAARLGDWAGYGREMDALAVTLERLGTLVGPIPAPVPVEPEATQTPATP